MINPTNFPACKGVGTIQSSLFIWARNKENKLKRHCAPGRHCSATQKLGSQSSGALCRRWYIHLQPWAKTKAGKWLTAQWVLLCVWFSYLGGQGIFRSWNISIISYFKIPTCCPTLAGFLSVPSLQLMQPFSSSYLTSESKSSEFIDHTRKVITRGIFFQKRAAEVAKVEVARDVETVIWFFSAFCSCLPEKQTAAAQAASQAVLTLVPHLHQLDSALPPWKALLWSSVSWQ